MTERSKYEDLEIPIDAVMELAPLMDELVKSRGWAALVEVVKGRKIQYRELLLKAGKDAFDRYAGRDEGMQEVVEIPAMLLTIAGQIQRREEIEEAVPRRRARPTLGDGGGPSF